MGIIIIILGLLFSYNKNISFNLGILLMFLGILMIFRNVIQNEY